RAGVSAVIDAVLSYHLNPNTCGVAKFNHALAKRLGVPCEQIAHGRSTAPLVSVKMQEIADGGAQTGCLPRREWRAYDLFLHDTPTCPLEHPFIACARKVYAANGAIAERLGSVRTDVITVHCPSTID